MSSTAFWRSWFLIKAKNRAIENINTGGGVVAEMGGQREVGLKEVKRASKAGE